MSLLPDAALRGWLASRESPHDTAAATAIQAWDAVLEATEGRVPVPSAGEGPGSRLMLCWDSGPHHLEYEIIVGSPPEWYYRNRGGFGAGWSKEWGPGQPLPGMALWALREISKEGHREP